MHGDPSLQRSFQQDARCSDVLETDSWRSHRDLARTLVSLHRQPAGQNRATHTRSRSLSFALPPLASLCCLPPAVLSSAIPSRLLCPVFHVSGVRLLFYFSPLCRRRSGPLLCIRSSFFYLVVVVVFCSAPLCLCLPGPPLPPWIHAFHVGTFVCAPRSSALSLCPPSSDVSVCAAWRSEWTRRGSKKTRVSQQAVLLSHAPLTLPLLSSLPHCVSPS